MTRARFVVRGLVQGVNFRATTAREATTRRLTGRVWNREDGAVGIVVEGATDAIDEFARWLKDGPRLAEVRSIEREDASGERRYQEFSVSYEPAS